MSLFLLAMLLVFFSCSEVATSDRELAYPDKTREEIPSLTDYNIVSIVTDSGNLKYKIIAPRFSVFDKARVPYRLFKEGIHFQTYLADGTPDANITSNYAIFWEQKELWELSSNVVAVNSKGEVFKTELLYWDTKKQQIYTNEFITITTLSKIICGNGFQSNQEFTNYQIMKGYGEFPVNLDE